MGVRVSIVSTAKSFRQWWLTLARPADIFIEMDTIRNQIGVRQASRGRNPLNNWQTSKRLLQQGVPVRSVAHQSALSRPQSRSLAPCRFCFLRPLARPI